MAATFSFSTRDWFWLCLVLFLAMGWGSHVRYSMWYENYANRPEPVTDDDLKAEMNEAIRARENMAGYLSDLRGAVSDALTEDQQKAVKAALQVREDVRKIHEENLGRGG